MPRHIITACHLKWSKRTAISLLAIGYCNIIYHTKTYNSVQFEHTSRRRDIGHLPPARLCIEDVLGSKQQCHTCGEAEDEVIPPLDVRRVS